MDTVNRLLFGSENKFETVLKDAVNKENEAKRTAKLKKLENNEKLYNDVTSLHMYMRDCTIDTPVPIKGVVEGTIPTWLNGTLFRNGPGKRSFGDMKTQHAFDSAALLRKEKITFERRKEWIFRRKYPFFTKHGLVRFTIKDGKVTFQSKFLKSSMFTKNTEAQRIVMSEFGTAATDDPCKSIFRRFASYFEKSEPTDNCLVSVYPYNDELYALTETVMIHRVDKQTLDSIRRVNLKDHISIVHHTAHPHLDEDGTVFNLGMVIGRGGVEYAIMEFPNTKRGTPKSKDVFADGKIAAKVPVRWRMSPCYMHSFGMSPNYFIIIEQPLGISAASIVIGKLTQKPAADSLIWYNEPTLIHVLSRETGQLVRTFEAEPFGFFHIINQFEENGQVIIDVCAYKDLADLNRLTEQRMEKFQEDVKFDEGVGRPVRYVCPIDPPQKDGNLVNLKGSTAKAVWCRGKIQVTAEFLLEKTCDMPRIHYEKYNGKNYRYFYCFSMDCVPKAPIPIEKVDIQTKTSKSWSEENAIPSEPIFVPNPRAEKEDDGVVLSSLLYTDNEKKITLLVLDAKDMTVLARADFETEASNPADFHGWYLSDGEMQRD